jgi:hypothetical protein
VKAGDQMRNVPLFPRPETTGAPKHSKGLEVHRAFRGTYAKYAPVKRVACDECVNVLHEAKGVGQPPLSARHTRKSGKGTLRLCHAHAELWREIDEVSKR